MAGLQDGYRTLIVAGLAALVAFLGVYVALDQRDSPEALDLDLVSLTPTANGPMEAYITGAVARPGVYEIRDGDRVVDLLSAAGGASADANLEAINLALRLHDEDQVTVPRLGEPAGTGTVGTATASVDINSASAAELDTLPGIGEVYSQRIVESRTRDGPFATTDELVERDVIPRSTHEKIRDLITAGP